MANKTRIFAEILGVFNQIELDSIRLATSPEHLAQIAQQK